jgi:hypothetical protein
MEITKIKFVSLVDEHEVTDELNSHIQGVFEVEAFLLTCDSIRCSKEF